MEQFTKDPAIAVAVVAAVLLVFSLIFMKQINARLVKMTIARKIAMLSGFWYVSFFAIGAVTFLYLFQVGEKMAALAERDLPLITALTELEIQTLQQVTSFERIQLAISDKDLAKLEKSRISYRSRAEAAQASLEKTAEMVQKDIEASSDAIHLK